MNELITKALKEAKEVKRSMVNASVGDVVKGLEPKVEKELRRVLKEEGGLYPSNYHEVDLDDTLGTEKADSYDDLSELGDGDAVTEEGFGDEGEEEKVEEGGDVDYMNTEEVGEEDGNMDLDLDAEIQEMANEFDMKEEGEDFNFDMTNEAEGEDIDIDSEFAAGNAEGEDEISVDVTDDASKDAEMEELSMKYESALTENIQLKKRIIKMKTQLTESAKASKSNGNDVKQLLEAIKTYKTALNESNLKYQKLVYSNKLMSSKKLNESYKTKFVQLMSKAKTINEARAVFEKFRTISPSKDNKVSKLTESVKQSSSIQSSAQGNDNSWNVARNKQLAGI